MASIEKRGNNYRITVSDGYNIYGEQIKRRMTWTPPADLTERQIKKELERQAVLFEDSVRSGQAVDTGIKFQAFTEQWFKDYGEIHLRPLTLQRYRVLTKRTYEAIGHIRIDRIQPRDLIAFYKTLGQENTATDQKRTAKEGIKKIISAQGLTYKELAELSGLGLRTIKAAANGESVSDKTADNIARALGIPKKELFNATVGADGRKLSEKTVKHYHAFISSVMERAVKWGIIENNPCYKVDTPKAPKKEIDCLTVEQAAAFLEHLTAEPLETQALFYSLLLTGLRRGELMGLEWSDVDFDNNTVTVRRTSQYTKEKGVFTDTTKTEQSKRRIAIPAELTELLRRYKREQMAALFALGDKWVKSDRLFVKWNGEPMHPNTPYQKLHKLLKKYGLPVVSLHSLRHTNATILIASGTDVRTVSGRLGHSQTSTTLNIYAHLLQSADTAAAETVSGALLQNSAARLA